MLHATEIESIARDALSGHYSRAAAQAASLRSRLGAHPEAAVWLAIKAGSIRHNAMLTLAFALWPQAQQQEACALFLSRVGPSCALYCLRNCPALLEAARQIEVQERVQAAAIEARALAKAARLKDFETLNSLRLAQKGLPKTPATIIRGRIRRAIQNKI